jgi:hypothetical protein
MQSKPLVLWENSSVNFPQGIGAHAWLSGSPKNTSGTGTGHEGDSSIYTGGISATHFPDASAVGGVWKRISVSNWDYLRIFGEFMVTDLDGTTATNCEVRAYAFYEPPGYTQNLRAANLMVGKDLIATNTNIFVPQRCGVFAWQYTATSNVPAVVVRGTDWQSGGTVLLRGLANQEYPLAHPTAPAVNYPRTWYLDVGHAQGIDGVGTAGTDTRGMYQYVTENGGYLARCSGMGAIYFALKFYNAGAWTGGTTPVVSGRLVATRARVGSGSV